LQARPPAAAKPRSDGKKLPHAASRPPAPGKGRSGPPAAEGVGAGDGGGPVGAGAKASWKVPAGRGKEKAPRVVQEDVPKVKGGQAPARKPRAAPGAGQGQAGLQKAAPAHRKAP